MNGTDRFDKIDKTYAYDGSLGALYTAERTVFKVWSPAAERVELNLYEDGSGGEKKAVYPMRCGSGVWETAVSGDLDGVYYTYTVYAGGAARESIDIYARAAGVNGRRGMVLAPGSADPDGWKDSRTVKLKCYCDAVLYELHVRDFSSDESGSFRYRGKFLAFTEQNVRNRYGERIGLDHIANLGVTHIHLLPVADFSSVDESSDTPRFNWGYDPMNYNLPEGSYSTDPYDGKVRITEFKKLIMAVHDRGLGVVMDVVYNHTYETGNSAFSVLCPGYYYRHIGGRYANGSGCGNEFASERKMASKFIVDSLCYLAEEYKLDGFRFDLMGLLDIATMNECARRLKRVNPDIILYGEGWTCNESPLDEDLRAVKKNGNRLFDIAMFSDDFRDSVKGSVFEDGEPGYINGGESGVLREKIKSLLCGGVLLNSSKIWEEKSPMPGPARWVNYVEAHDNLTFHDKLVLTMPEAKEDEIINVDKLGAALIFLSQGIPFLQAGQEFFRSKPLPGGGFDHDSYVSPDGVNSLKWDDLTVFRELADYYKGLIAIRKKFPIFRMTDEEQIRDNITFIDLERNALAVFIGDFLLLINPGEKDIIFDAVGEVYADKYRAADVPFRTVAGNTCCEAKSILLVKTGERISV